MLTKLQTGVLKIGMHIVTILILWELDEKVIHLIKFSQKNAACI